MQETVSQRTGHVLNSKLRKYLIPTIATALALSLDEFVDSILVANLLDLQAMTLISVASPIVLIVSATYILFGIGGSTLYALNIGQRNTRAAGKAFGISLSTALMIAILICISGLSFLKPLSSFLSPDTSMQTELTLYLRVLFLTAPFIIGIQTLSGFLPAAGVPNISTLICLIANVSNLVFDYVYIRFLHLGVSGTAYATLTGYVICLIVLLVLLLRKKIHLYLAIPAWKDYRDLREVFAQGGATALGQIGYTVKYAFFNQLSMALGGTVALQVFAVCRQLISIMSIGLAGIADAVAPFMAALKGQKDNRGIKFVLRSGMIYITGISGALVVLFELFPQLLYKMFNVVDPAVISMAGSAIRVFLLTFLFRGVYILYMDYARISGREGYAMLISLLDGFVLLVPAALLCTRIFDTAGIWASFPLSSILILLGMIVYNRILAKRSNGRLSGLFLLEQEENVTVCDMTIGEEDEAISQMSDALIRFCTENGVRKNVAAKIGLIAEEMAVYTRLHRKKSEQIDIMVRISDEGITLDFRSEGTPFNPLARSEEDNDANLQLINKIPSEIAYDYILGMNSTRFTMENN